MQVHDLAANLIAEAPCAIELPAGSGKTHLLATIVAEAERRGDRPLILTHTNAGVDALRKRLSAMNVPPESFRIDTITSWAFQLVRAYGRLAGVTVPKIPDWTESSKYIDGAVAVVEASAVRDMLRGSFGLMLVDEYQDCNLKQHAFIVALSHALPKTIVFGDRLQGIFGFADPLVGWDKHVFARFPKRVVPHVPHRWATTNPELGQWLLDIRPTLAHGETFDLRTYLVPGLRYVQSSPTAVASSSHSNRNFSESVCLLDKWPGDVATHASRLGGSYSVMEDIAGRFMKGHLGSLPTESSHLNAGWLASFAKSCVVGLAGLDSPLLNKLTRNESILHYSRDGLHAIVNSLDELRRHPSRIGLVEAAHAIAADPAVRVFRWEAWRDTLAAITESTANGTSPIDEFGLIRERIRHVGRSSGTRVASRTLLVKGLEYDHVIIADLSKFTDPRNLYVALSRARRSVTIIGPSPWIALRDD
jgi:hypothetical protein